MKKNLLFIFALLTLIISCDDIETNDPAFQALIDDSLYRSNDTRAEIKPDGTLVVQGLNSSEQLSITLSNAQVGTYTFSGNGFNRASYVDPIGSFYTTRPFGNGEVIIENIDDSNVSGTFKFTAYRFGLDTLVASNGRFYNVPIIPGSTEEEPEPETFHFFAKVNDLDFIPIQITANNFGNTIVIKAEAENNSITIQLPDEISVGSYDFDNEIYYAIYTEETNTYPAEDGSVIITSHDIDLNSITGTFTFHTGEPSNITVTQGEFAVFY